MSWTCTARVSPDCVTEGLSDPPRRDSDGAPVCIPCARDLDHEDEPPARPTWDITD